MLRCWFSSYVWYGATLKCSYAILPADTLTYYNQFDALRCQQLSPVDDSPRRSSCISSTLSFPSSILYRSSTVYACISHCKSFTDSYVHIGWKIGKKCWEIKFEVNYLFHHGWTTRLAFIPCGWLADSCWLCKCRYACRIAWRDEAFRFAFTPAVAV